MLPPARATGAERSPTGASLIHAKISIGRGDTSVIIRKACLPPLILPGKSSYGIETDSLLVVNQAYKNTGTVCFCAMHMAVRVYGSLFMNIECGVRVFQSTYIFVNTTFENGVCL